MILKTENIMTMIESQLYLQFTTVMCCFVFFISMLAFMIMSIEIKKFIYKIIGFIIVVSLSGLILYGSQPFIKQLAKNEVNKIEKTYNEIIQK